MERCYDSSCGFENRADYCEQDAKDPDGYVSYVIEAIDELLYNQDQIASGRMITQADRHGLRTERSFALSHFDPNTYILPLTRTVISITHNINRATRCNEYRIDLGWAVERPEFKTDPFLVQYAIDVYESGDVQAQIEQPNIITEGRDRSPLTNYDYEKLYEVLDLFARSQRAEGADNSRAQAA